MEYIEEIAPAVVAACKKCGGLASDIIAMSCLENGYGIPDYWDNPEIEKLLKYNNMLGLKAQLLNTSWDDKSVWPGKAFSKKTPEEYDGRKVTVKDSFRIYDSPQQSFEDFLLFLTYASNDGKGGKPKYGRAVIDIKDPKAWITAVKERGYATDSSYVSSVMRIINKHNLTVYNKTEPEPKPIDISINKKYITTNNSYSTNDPKTIIIHNTDNFDPGADAKAHAEWLATDTDTGMSWHFAVDDRSIYQCLPYNRGAFHVGRNYGSNNLFNVYGGRDHKNTIAIEMCVNRGYDYEKAFQNTVKLTKYLMKELGIPAERVYQHYDICSKNCPSQIRAKGDWGRFKKLIAEDAPAPTPAKTKKVSASKTMKKAIDLVARTAKKNGWTYGDSRSDIPCDDKKISCDRLIARALYLMGFKDQIKGGETCGTLDKYLTSKGWKKVTKKSDIKAGAVVAVRSKKNKNIDHVFFVASYNKETDRCTKYDCGSNERIKQDQPFRNVPLVEWSDKVFVCAWNVPTYLASGLPNNYVFKNVDYSDVFKPTYYSRMYPDVVAVYGKTYKKLFEHFLNFGMKEGRQAYAGFNPIEYKKRYKDLRNAFGNDLTLYYKHYCEFGKNEGRDAI